MRKALLISYRFPPQGGGGVQRTLKYAKYLRAFGWEPVVHTARDPFWPVWDESLLADIPDGVRVYRTRAFEFERLEARVMGWLRGGRGSRGAAGSARQGSGGGAAAGGARRGGGRLAALRAQIHKRLLVPDPQIAWLPLALLHGSRIARREGVRLIHSSSPPNSVHLFAGLLARRTGLPWIADFRDPWTDGPRRRRAYEGNRPRERVEKAAERWVARRADRIVVSAPALRERFLEKYDFLHPEHVHVLTNGFDPEDFEQGGAGAEPLLEPGRFHLVGTGNIEAMFDRRPFYRAIAAVCAARPEIARDLRVTLVGAKAEPYREDLRALGLEDRVRFPGWVPHSESLRYLREADALVMCQLPHAGGGGEKLSGKSFEYLNMRKPILCLTVPGITADLLRESRLGVLVDPFDQDGIERALADLHERRGRPAAADEAVIERFDRRRLTERLARLFDELDAAADGVRDLSPAAGVP